jgi:hypothetical protein
MLRPSSRATISRPHRVVWLAVALILAGCQAPMHRPDFMARSIEDCAHGDQSACWMLDALRVRATDADDQTGLRSPARLPVGTDADAIMDGINRTPSHASAAN